MTARRRRKSGSGPSATALIAWVGGARASIGAPAVAPASVTASGPTGRMAGGRAIFLGRACGLAAGTLLACGSVLAGATHVGDGSLAKDSVALLDPTPTAPDVTIGTEYRADPPVESAAAAPDAVSAQALTEPSRSLHPQLGRVRRNAPVSMAMPADEPIQNPRTAQQPWQSSPPATGPAPQNPIAPVNPVLDPAAKGVDRVAPVGGVLAPNNPNNPDTLTNPRQVRAERSREKQAGSSSDDRATSSRGKRTGLTTCGPVKTVQKVVTPVDNTISQTIEPVVKPVVQPATRPAMTMLTSSLPIG
jgi:hypothetical protein